MLALSESSDWCKVQHLPIKMHFNNRKCMHLKAFSYLRHWRERGSKRSIQMKRRHEGTREDLIRQDHIQYKHMYTCPSLIHCGAHKAFTKYRKKMKENDLSGLSVCCCKKFNKNVRRDDKQYPHKIKRFIYLFIGLNSN